MTRQVFPDPLPRSDNRPSPLYWRLLLGWVYLVLSAGPALCQSEDSLLNKVLSTLDRYATHHSAPCLFLHLDKSVYQHGEHIQFTAWSVDGRIDTGVHALYVTLTDPSKRKMLVFDRFVIDQGIGTGAINIPDSLEGGDYLITAYTDEKLDGRAQNFFRQHVSILSGRTPPFAMQQLPFRPGNPPGPGTPVTFRITTDYLGLAAGGNFHYSLRSGIQGADSGDKKIDPFGEITLSLPAGDSAADDLQLTATVTRAGLSQSFWEPVQTGSPQWTVHYYPEGGNLINGQPGRIGIQIRDNRGRAVRTKGRLLSNGVPVTIFQSDDNGWGVIDCLVSKEYTYDVDFPDRPAGTRIVAHFPDIQPQGYTLHVQDGIARDTVNAEIYLPSPDKKCRLLIYNDHSIAYASVFLAHSEAVRLKIPVINWPPGLLTMTLFDNDGLPVAERTLYSPPPALHLTISPDSSVYHTRSKIRLRIHATDEKGEGIPAFFSLSAVLQRYLHPDAMPDIVRYASLDRYLQDGPAISTAGLPKEDDDPTINGLLLTRCWSSYHWSMVAADSLSDDSTRHKPSQSDDEGYVLYKGKQPPQLLNMVVMGGAVATFTTDSNGYFRIPRSALISQMGGYPAVYLSGVADQQRYTILLHNHYDSLNRAIAQTIYRPPYKEEEDSSATEEGGHHPFGSVKTLQQVIVRPPNAGLPGCKDYVCLYGILNCPNHPYGQKPEIGRAYRMSTGKDFTGRDRLVEIVYRSCQVAEQPLPPYVRKIKAIYLVRETYEPDSLLAPPPSPATYTTLHWSPLVATDEKGFAAISFYSNDLPGRYETIAEGISPRGPLSGRQAFQVK